MRLIFYSHFFAKFKDDFLTRFLYQHVALTMLLSIDIHICGYVVSYFYSSLSIPRFLRHVKGENC